MDTTKTITHIGLCAGYGGIELGLKRVIPNLRSVALCEIEAFACANLVAKMEAGLMEPAPIWTDLKSFHWESFRDRVDILTGGYPCQPFSAAGKRLGTEDPRHLWPFIASGIRILRPKLCFFENVEGHISLGLREVIGELEQMGYKVSWGIFSAREVGAPHQRKRVFILAVSNSLGGAAGLSRSLAWNEGIAGESNHGSYEVVANTRRIEPQGWCGAADGQQSGAGRIPRGESTPRHDQVWPSRPGEPQHAWEPPRVVGNASSERSGTLGTEPAVQQWQASIASTSDAMGNAEQFLLPASRKHGTMDEASGIPADREGCESAQTDSIAGAARKREGGGGDATECCETQPALGGNAYGPAGGLDYAELQVSCDNRTDELRLLGNGVVPATAERAFRILMEEL